MKYTKAQLDEVGRILALPQKKRWRAAADFTIKHNNWAKIEHKEVLKSIKEVRKELKNEYGTTDDPNSGLRWGMRIPESVLAGIKMFDPELDRESGKTEESRQLQKKEWRKMMEVFPEYKVLIRL